MISLDHVGVVGHVIAEMRETWLDAGFFVTEPEELMALEPGTGKRVSLGQHSCHVILERGYIELTAVDHATPSHHLYPWITSGVSLGILALGTDDIEALHRRLLDSRIPVGPLAQASRPIHYGARRGDALFTWFALGAKSTPESLLCFVRNERPELIYQPEVQQHSNDAKSLDAVIICSNEPALTAARYAEYCGIAGDTARREQVAPGLMRCALDKGAIWVGTASALSAHFDNDIPSSLGETPRSIGFLISTRPDAYQPARERVFWFCNGAGLR